MHPFAFQQKLSRAQRAARNYTSYVDAFDRDLKRWMSFPLPLNASDFDVMTQQNQAMHDSRARFQLLRNHDVLSATIDSLVTALRYMPEGPDTLWGGNSRSTNERLVGSVKAIKNEQHDRLLRLTDLYDTAKGVESPEGANTQFIVLERDAFQRAFPLFGDEDVTIRQRPDLTNAMPNLLEGGEFLSHMLVEDLNPAFDGVPNDDYLERLRDEEWEIRESATREMRRNGVRSGLILDAQRRHYILGKRIASMERYTPSEEMHEGQASHPTAQSPPHHYKVQKIE